MKSKVLVFIVFISVGLISNTFSEEEPTKEKIEDELRKVIWEYINPYDYFNSLEAKHYLKKLLIDVKDKMEDVNLEKEEFLNANAELFFPLAYEFVKALQIFYKKSLNHFDQVLETVVKIRKEQRAVELETGEAFVNIVKAVLEMELPENETVIGAVFELQKNIESVSKNGLKVIYELAKDDFELQKVLEIQEDAVVELKKIIIHLASAKGMPKSLAHLISDFTEPFVTVFVIGSIFGTFEI